MAIEHMSNPLVWGDVQEYLRKYDALYPGILDWLKATEAEFHSGLRTVFLAHDSRGICGLSITKNKRRAKLCHISVSARARGRGVGRLLISMSLAEMSAKGARDVCVTTEEDVFREYRGFFSRAGFQECDWIPNLYRRGKSEIIWRRDAARLSSPCRSEEDIQVIQARGDISINSRDVSSEFTRKNTRSRDATFLTSGCLTGLAGLLASQGNRSVELESGIGLIPILDLYNESASAMSVAKSAIMESKADRP